MSRRTSSVYPGPSSMTSKTPSLPYLFSKNGAICPCPRRANTSSSSKPCEKMIVRRGSKPFCRRCVMDSPDLQPLHAWKKYNAPQPPTLSHQQRLVIRGSPAPDVLAVVVTAERPMGPSVKGRGRRWHDVVVGHTAISVGDPHDRGSTNSSRGLREGSEPLNVARMPSAEISSDHLELPPELTVDVLYVCLFVSEISLGTTGRGAPTQAGKSPSTSPGTGRMASIADPRSALHCRQNSPSGFAALSASWHRPILHHSRRTPRIS